jgi:hypothetical protein
MTLACPQLRDYGYSSFLLAAEDFIDALILDDRRCHNRIDLA